MGSNFTYSFRHDSILYGPCAHILIDVSIFATGTIQYCFESAMYTFVFLWSPVLEKAAGDGIVLPFGVIFSSFMVCIMIGSILFKIMMRYEISEEIIARRVFLIACFSFLVPAITKVKQLILD